MSNKIEDFIKSKITDLKLNKKIKNFIESTINQLDDITDLNNNSNIAIETKDITLEENLKDPIPNTLAGVEKPNKTRKWRISEETQIDIQTKDFNFKISKYNTGAIFDLYKDNKKIMSFGTEYNQPELTTYIKIIDKENIENGIKQITDTLYKELKPSLKSNKPKI